MSRVVSFSDRTAIACAAIEGGTAAAVTAVTLSIEDEAKQRAPVRFGNLKRSIQSEVGDGTGAVAVGAEYGVYVEEGTARMAAQPFLEPAVQAVEGQIDRIVDAVLREARLL